MGKIICRDARKGTYIVLDDKPYMITKFEFHKPGKGQPICILELESVMNKQKKEFRSSPHKTLEEADINKTKVQFLYSDESYCYFLHSVTYETIPVSKNILNDNIRWLKESEDYDAIFFHEDVIDISIPFFIDTVIVESAPGVRGNTASGRVMKPAVIQEGLEISVPIFIEEGDAITVDTRDNSYVSKANKTS